MRKTKIVCTIGPAVESEKMLCALANAGMNIARLNMSHGGHEEHIKVIEKIREINKSLAAPIPILADLQGPVIRVGKIGKKAVLKEGNKVVVTTKDVAGSEQIFSISNKQVPRRIKKGAFIYIADGAIELKVINVIKDDMICEVITGGEISARKNVNITGIKLDLQALTQKDIQDLEFAIENKVDFVGLSFVRKAADVLKLKQIIKQHKSPIHVIAKIENAEGLKNIDSIIRAADGIMVARGDLGIQLPIEDIPHVQKDIIAKCKEMGKPVITATQMLDSMIKNPRPTRAEVTDVANSIIDGTDAVMLSGETSIGKYPIRTVEIMNKIARRTEVELEFRGIEKGKDESKDIQESLSRSVCQSAYELNASAIIVFTITGASAKRISKLRPHAPIIAVTPNKEELARLNIFWGVLPFYVEQPRSTDLFLTENIKEIRKLPFIKKNSIAIIVGGIPLNQPGNTNFMKIHVL